MNKVFNINVGGLPLTIDEDAYRYLENYLQTLHTHFRNSEGYEEIMNDIEGRIGELLKENMGKRAIAMIQDVKNAVSVMGTPEDFGAATISEEEPKKSTSTEGSTSDIKTGKRLFRDSDNKVISGVCAGIAAYFGIQDAIWIRLLFLAILFFFGTGILLYIVLSIVIPEAKTTADRLAMRGEPIDVNTIAKSVSKGVEDISMKVNEFGNPENQERFRNNIHQASSKIGSAVGFILRGMGGIWKILATIVGIGLIIMMLIAWVSGAIGLTMAYPLFSYMTDSHFTPPVVIVSVFFLVSIPIISMVFFLRRLLFRRPASGIIMGSIWSVWTISFFVLLVVGTKMAKEFNQKAEVTEVIELSNPAVETLTVTTMNNPYGEINMQMGSIHVSEDYLLIEDVRLKIVKSDNDKFQLVKNINSRGKNQEEARKYLSNIDYKLENVNNELHFAHEFQIPKGTKWRDQNVNLTLKVPIGKKIRIKKDDSGRGIDINMDERGDWELTRACWEADVAIWEMTANGMKCLNDKKVIDEDENE